MGSKPEAPELTSLSLPVLYDKDIRMGKIFNVEFETKNPKFHGIELFIETESHKCMIRVNPMEYDNSLYCVRFETNHKSFPLKKSCTIRSFCSFYALQRTLLSLHPMADLEPLPQKQLLWIQSSDVKIEES